MEFPKMDPAAMLRAQRAEQEKLAGLFEAWFEDFATHGDPTLPRETAKKIFEDGFAYGKGMAIAEMIQTIVSEMRDRKDGEQK